MSNETKSDFENLKELFYQSFPEYEKNCDNCIHSTWEKNKSNKLEDFTSYCNKKKVNLKELNEADNCELFTKKYT